MSFRSIQKSPATILLGKTIKKLYLGGGETWIKFVDKVEKNHHRHQLVTYRAKK